MKVLGIDAGFSEVNATSSYCILECNDRSIELIKEPTNFIYSKCPEILTKDLLESIDIVTIDAPMTIKRILNKPKSGRKLDKLFSGDIFNNSKRGPQPGSISTPKQGWPLYEVGMYFKEYFETQGFEYNSINTVKNNSKVIFEIIPKMTQVLPIERNILIERPKNSQIDNYLFRYTFESNSKFRKSFRGKVFSKEIESLITKYINSEKKYHEELAGLLAALQGCLYVQNSYSLIGVDDEIDGCFLLPPIEMWSIEWKNAFERRQKKYKEVIIETEFDVL